MKKEKSTINRIFWISICVLLTIYALSIIFTLLWGLVSSLKNQKEFLFDSSSWLGFPILDPTVKWNSRNQFFKLSNYLQIFEDYHLV
jgi:ABC-type glycerol-3-phosphate transport system permease component